MIAAEMQWSEEIWEDVTSTETSDTGDGSERSSTPGHSSPSPVKKIILPAALCKNIPLRKDESSSPDALDETPEVPLPANGIHEKEVPSNAQNGHDFPEDFKYPSLQKQMERLGTQHDHRLSVECNHPSLHEHTKGEVKEYGNGISSYLKHSQVPVSTSLFNDNMIDGHTTTEMCLKCDPLNNSDELETSSSWNRSDFNQQTHMAAANFKSMQPKSFKAKHSSRSTSKEQKPSNDKLQKTSTAKRERNKTQIIAERKKLISSSMEDLESQKPLEEAEVVTNPRLLSSLCNHAPDYANSVKSAAKENISSTQKQHQNQQQQQQQRELRQSNNPQHSHDHHGYQDESSLYMKASLDGEETYVRHFHLHEYEKPKPASSRQKRRKYNLENGRFRNSYEYEKLDDDDDDDDDDNVNAIVCVVFCVMGLGVIVGLLCLLYTFVEGKEKEQQLTMGQDDFLDVLNSVYRRRITDIICHASYIDGIRLRPGGKNTSNNTIGSFALTNLEMQLKSCPVQPDNLVGNTTDVNLNITLDINEIIKNNSDVLPGGEWKPPSCISRHRVAIVIPYRDRWNHLKVLLHYLIPTLKRQQIHFRIFIVEQYGNETFNKGRIMNAAFREALKLFDFQCVTFHDVDLVPEDDRNMYSCTEQPKHMSISIDKFQYTLPYQGLVGGVLMFRAEHFQLVNGYSNMYWGWGAEDDDMTTRILHHGLRIYRPPSNIARYKMVKHHGRKTSEVAVRMKLLRSAARRSKMEGLNNVQYKLLETHIEKLFTHFIVDIGHP